MTDGLGRDPAPARPEPPSGRVFLVAAALLLAAVALATAWLDRERAMLIGTWGTMAERFDRHTALDQIFYGMVSAEGAQRGYLRTGNPGFLPRLEAERRALPRRLDALRRAYRDDPEVAAHIVALAQARSDAIDEIMRLYRTGHRDAAVDRNRHGPGGPLMAELRRRETEALVQENGALAEGYRRVRDQIRFVQFTCVLVLASGAVFTLAMLALSWRSRRRHHALELRTHDALTRLGTVFANTSDAIIVLDPAGRIEEVNASAARLIGRPAEACIGVDVRGVFDVPDDPGKIDRRLEIADGRLRHPESAECHVRRPDGTRVPVEVALALMPLPDGPRVIASVRDIGERRAAAAMKDEFITTVSHELRTPLTSVVGALGLLRSGAAGQLADAARRLVEIAENNSRRLIRLINDILDIERIGMGRLTLDLRPLDVDALGARAIEDAAGLAEARGVRLAMGAVERQLGGSLRVRADHDRMLQVLANLLSNAIRFSPAGGTVTLSIVAQPGRAVLRVDDEGPGVAPEFRARVFERFAQSSAGAAIPGGTGLGLAIAREIVQAHSGDVWFEDAPGGGARFAVSLPALAERESHAPDARRILVCEDEALVAEMLRDIIEDDGFEVDRCGTAGEAATLAATGRYAAAVLDVNLPDGSGLDVVRALRDSATTRRLPVVMVSGLAGADEQDPAYRALGITAWLAKPVNAGRLTRALARALAHAADDRPSILHVDGDPDTLEVTAAALADRGRMLKATGLASARAVLTARRPAVAILDIDLPDGSGLDLLPDLRGGDGAPLPIILYSASEVPPEIERQVDAVLVKSRGSLDGLSDTVRDILAETRVAEPDLA